MYEQRPDVQSVSSETPGIGGDLTPNQRAVLGCVACFGQADRAAEAKDIAACRVDMNVSQVRFALKMITRKGLAANTATSEQRKNTFVPTPEGRAVAGDLSADCQVVRQEKPLSPSLQKALGCVACLSGRGVDATRSRVASCERGPNNLHTAGAALYALEKRGDIGAPQRGAYVITAQGETRVPVSSESCRVADAVPALTADQQAILDCLRCQVAHGERPDRQRTALCMDMDSQRVRRAAKVLAGRGIITIHTNRERPGLRSQGRLQSYVPTDIPSFGSKRKPDCQTAAKQMRHIRERLTPNQEDIMRCLSCIESRIEGGLQLPGASALLLERCTGKSNSTIWQFLQELVVSGYYEAPRKGFSASDYGQAFYRPGQAGKLLLGLVATDEAKMQNQCGADIDTLTRIPLHTRNEIIRCIGCLWTHCIADGRPPVASATAIAECSGVNRSHMSKDVLPRLAAEGFVKAVSDEQYTRLYVPPKKLRVLIGYSDLCSQRPLTHELASQPIVLSDDYVGASDQLDAHEFDVFQSFVETIEAAAPAKTIDYNILGKLATQYPLLTAQEESFLAMIVQRNTDPQTVEKALFTLVASNVRLAHWMTNRRHFEIALTSYEEVLQAALVGVYRAAETFNPNMGFKFSTYCYQAMHWEIRRATSSAMGIKRDTLYFIEPVRIYTDDFKKSQGRHPTVPELAASMNQPRRYIEEALAAHTMLNGPTVRLNAPADGVIDGSELHELIGKTDSSLEEVEIADIFDELRGHLNPLEQSVLQHVILGDMAPSAYAEASQLDLYRVKRTAQRVKGIMRHPYFRIGQQLNESMFGWQHDAQCVVEGAPAMATQTNLGNVHKRMCERCPVREQCVALGKSTDPVPISGLWGGAHSSSLRRA